MSTLDQPMNASASRLKPRWRTDRLQAFVLVVGLALIGLVWTGILYHLHLRDVAVREQTHRDVANLSIGVEKHVERLLVGVDQVMRFIADDFARDPETFDFAAWLKRATSLQDVAHQISLFNEHGELLASRTPPSADAPRFNIRDRDYFLALQASAERGLYIDRTLKGRITGRYVLQTARRLSHHDGSFAGVIVTSVDPDYLAQQFKALDVGSQGSVAIFGTDGFIRARYPQAEAMYERDVSSLSTGKGVFAYAREQPAGTYEVRSAFDGVTRIFGYRTVGSLPLIVTVGKSLDEVLAPLAGERHRAVLAGLGLTLVLLAMLLLLIRGLETGRRQQALLAAKEAAASAAEVQAREANRLLTLAAQIAHIGHWRISLPDNALFWSDEVFAIFGRSPSAGPPSVEEAIAAYATEDQAEVARCVEEAVREGRGYTFSAQIVHTDGSLRDVSCRGVCEVDASGTTTAVFGTIMDVTELRRIEQSVIESEARFRMLADNTSDMIVQVDMDTTRRYVSPASRDLLGFEPEELLGTKPLDMVHPDDRKVVAAVIADLQTGSRKQALKRQRYRRKDGTYVWVEVSYRAIHDADGTMIGCIACTRDISQRVTAEKALSDSEYLFRLLAENTSELIMLGHDDGRRSYVSPASLRLLGYTPEELGAMRLRDYVHPDDVQRLYATTRSLGPNRLEAACEYRARHKDRGWTWVEGVFRRIPGAVGDEPTIVATFRDISERKEQAEALQKAKLEAERASAAKTDFLAAMSHEIRTPLHAILSFTEMMLGSGRLPTDLQRNAELVSSSGKTLLTIVNDILDFSKVEAGAIELSSQSFNPTALAENCLSIIRGLAEPKGLDVRAIVEPDLPKALFGDETRLQQILLNLLNNAVKFTRAGSVTLVVRHEGRAIGGEQLRFTVIDTGIGIPPEKQNRLFQRFSQVDNSIHRDFGGSGLGLAICKRLVELMGGEIGVASREGRGATFWFTVTLPRASVRLVEDRPIASVKARRAGHLLVVEDSEINQIIARAVLEEAGHRIEVVSDGAAAVFAVEEGQHDLVLMDVQMPGMDGLTATRMIRRLKTPSAHVPILAMTANVLPEQVKAFTAAGMNGHVAKPFERDALLATIEQWLTEGHASPPEITDAAAIAVDRSAVDRLRRDLGPAKVRGLLELLVEELSQIFSGAVETDDEREQIRREAHILTSAAGSLGFVSLSAACQALEASAARHTADHDLDVLRARLAETQQLCRAAQRSAQSLIEELREESPLQAVQ